MEKEILGRAIIIAVLIALLVIVFLDYILIIIELYNPFSDKAKFVKYYACSLAICTHGCNWLETHKICLEKGISGECNLWCNDACMNMPDACNKAGDCCGPEHKLNVGLNGKTSLRCYPGKNEGHSDIYSQKYVRSGSGVKTFYNILSEKEGLPKIMGPRDESILDESCAGKLKCLVGPLDMNFPGQMRTDEDWDTFFQCSKIGKAGIGYIYMDSSEAIEKYGCYGVCPMYAFGGDSNSFDECDFQGKINIWAVWGGEQCADVSVRAEEAPSEGDFVIWPDPETKTIPLNQQDSFKINITNNFDDPQTFKLKIESVNEAGCSFVNGGTNTTIDLEGRSSEMNTGSVSMFCKPTKAPPSGEYTIVINANNGVITHFTKVNVGVTDFGIKVTPEEQTINPGGQAIFNVEVENGLGRNADFILSTDNPGICKFANEENHLNVLDNDKNKTTMICNPPGSGETYIITVGASYTVDSNTLYHDDNVNIIVPSCSISGSGLELKFFRGNEPIEEIYSGEDFTIEASGFSGCQNYLVNFYVEPNLNISYCNVDSTGGRCTSGKKTAGTPGVYIFNATMVVKDVIYNASKILPIKKPSIDAKSCEFCNNDWCTFSLDRVGLPCGSQICDHAACGGWSSTDCTDACSPQTCWQDPVKNECARYSNICCVNNKDFYSPGPSGGPACLSPETNSHNDENNYFEWTETDNPRNVLVNDGTAANIKFNGRLNIKISDEGRPVYGVKLIAKRSSSCSCTGRCPSPECPFYIYLSNFTDVVYSSGTLCTSSNFKDFIFRPTDGSWSWNNVVTITLDNCLDVDYVGLLTKGADIPYCTEGNATDYYRTVDDGKSCYWGLYCPMNGRGWRWEGKSTSIGPLVNVDNPLTDVSCDCGNGSCGNGFCEKTIGENRLCYYDAKCRHGGWVGIRDECNPGETCTSEGCE